MNMRHRNLVLGFTIIVLVLIAGCTSNAPSVQPSQVTPVSKLSTIEPSEMALQLSDLPENFIIIERMERTPSDVEKVALDNGWKKGYTVTFSRVDLNQLEGVAIKQDVSIYPVEKISQILPVIKQTYKQKFANTSLVEDLSNPNIGDQSQALRITDNNDKSKIFVITFVKDDVLESFAMAGITTDYETLKNLAQKAAAKIK